jgi:hypothetical protein
LLLLGQVQAAVLKALEELVDESVLLVRELRPLATGERCHLEVTNALEELRRSGQLVALLTEDLDLLLRGLPHLLVRRNILVEANNAGNRTRIRLVLGERVDRVVESLLIAGYGQHPVDCSLTLLERLFR